MSYKWSISNIVSPAKHTWDGNTATGRWSHLFICSGVSVFPQTCSEQYISMKMLFVWYLVICMNDSLSYKWIKVLVGLESQFLRRMLGQKPQKAWHNKRIPENRSQKFRAPLLREKFNNYPSTWTNQWRGMAWWRKSVVRVGWRDGAQVCNDYPWYSLDSQWRSLIGGVLSNQRSATEGEQQWRASTCSRLWVCCYWCQSPSSSSFWREMK